MARLPLSAQEIRVKFVILGFVVLLATSFSRVAFTAEIPDTHGNRLVAARAYLEIVPMREMIRDITFESAKNLPESVRSTYIEYMTTTVRAEVLESVALASMAQHFTVGELQALAAFYGSPLGRSAMKKFGAYTADLMPVIQQEMLRAKQRLESQSRQSR